MRRWLMALGLIALASLGLSACDNNLWQGPIAVRASDQSLEIAVCTPGPIDEVLASYRNVSTNLDWVDFWKANTRLEIAQGDVFANGAIAGQKVGTFMLPDLPGGTEVDIVFYVDESPVASAVFKIPAAGLPADQWLHSDGAVSPESCESAG